MFGLSSKMSEPSLCLAEFLASLTSYGNESLSLITLWKTRDFLCIEYLSHSCRLRQSEPFPAYFPHFTCILLSLPFLPLSNIPKCNLIGFICRTSQQVNPSYFSPKPPLCPTTDVVTFQVYHDRSDLHDCNARCSVMFTNSLMCRKEELGQ